MRTFRPLALSILTLLLLAAASPATAVTDRGEGDVCRASEEVSEIIREARDLRRDCGSSLECVEPSAAILEAGLEEHPGNVHLEKELQNAWRFADLEGDQKARRDEVNARYAVRAAEHPDDPRWAYLAARAELDPERSRDLYEEATEVGPEYPWAHLGLLVAQRQAGDPPDAEAERRHLAVFLDRCPAEASLAVAGVRALGKDPFWRERLETARELLLQEDDLEERYVSLDGVWRALYAATPLDQHESLAAKHRKDLARIEALDLRDEEVWWQVRKGTYETLGDEAGVERVSEEMMAAHPCSTSTSLARMAAWREEHELAEDASDEERARYGDALWARVEEWLEECPDAGEYRFSQLEAARMGAELSAEQLRELETTLVELEASGKLGMSNSIELMMAGIYLEREIELDRLDGLIERGLEAELEETRAIIDDPAYPDDLKELMAQSLPVIELTALSMRARAALLREDTDPAREMLAEIAAWLDDQRPGEDASDVDRQRFLAYEADAMTRSAELAEVEDRHADAAVLFARAAAQQMEPEETLEKGRAAWEAAGGSAEGWQSLREGLAGTGATLDRATLRWAEKETELPAEFEVVDLGGETWRRADFEGKAVFVNLWATWCGPCRKELPEVEKLYERMKDRDDVVVVTFNLDENPGAAKRYAEKEEMTVPVLLAGDLMETMGGVSGIPRSWIVDPSVTIRREAIGFGDAEGWVDEVVGLLEEYGAGDE